MREIKFRFACRDIAGGIFFRLKTLDELIRGQWDIGKDGLIQEILGRDQFTGLKDKNGKEIYEGDIIHYGYYEKDDDTPDLERPMNMKVHYSASDGGYIANGRIVSFSGDKYPFEVIGNIYENPELLQ